MRLVNRGLSVLCLTRLELSDLIGRDRSFPHGLITAGYFIGVMTPRSERVGRRYNFGFFAVL